MIITQSTLAHNPLTQQFKGVKPFRCYIGSMVDFEDTFRHHYPTGTIALKQATRFGAPFWYGTTEVHPEHQQGSTVAIYRPCTEGNEFQLIPNPEVVGTETPLDVIDLLAQINKTEHSALKEGGRAYEFLKSMLTEIEYQRSPETLELSAMLGNNTKGAPEGSLVPGSYKATPVGTRK